jgi:N-acetylglucosamine-6-phosphate deacetylase
MQIANGRILTENSTFQRHDLILKGDGIEKITSPYFESGEETLIDAEGGYVLPGLIDLCVRGGEGMEFASGDSVQNDALSAWLARQGVARYLGVLRWQEEENFHRVLKAARLGQETEYSRAVLAGLRLEGPSCASLQTQTDGGQPQYLDPALFEKIAGQAGTSLRMLDVSPELPGAITLVRRAAPHCRVSLVGAAGYDQARIGFACGARHVSRLTAAMERLSSQDPGLLGAACECDCMVDISPQNDGMHPAALRLAFQLFGPERVCLVSRGPGSVRERYSLTDCVRSAAWFGVPLSFAVRAATLNPAKVLGIEKQAGSIAVGKCADILILDLHDLSLRTVIRRGEVLYDKGKRMSLGG